MTRQLLRDAGQGSRPRLSRRDSRARLRTFPGTGHFFSWENWPAYAVAVCELADQAVSA